MGVAHPTPDALDTARPRPAWPAFGLLLLNLAAYAGLVYLQATTGTLLGPSTWAMLGWCGLATGGYLLALGWAERGGVPLRVVWIGAALFQGVLLLQPSSLSTDVFRYLWDGHLATHGVSPYAYPIDAPALDGLDTPIRAQADHTWMASPYLPTAQALFAATAALLPLEPRAMQAVMALINLGVGWLMLRLLDVAGLPRRRLLIYLWHPLVIVETAHGAHQEAWLTGWLLLAVWAALAPRRGMTWLSPVALALATLTKIVPVISLPVLLPRWRGWGRLVFGATTLALLLPFGLTAGWGLTGPLDGRGVFGAIRIYGNQWNYNSGLFHWLAQGLADAAGLEPVAATQLAKRLVALALIAVLAAVWMAARRADTPAATLRLLAVPWMAYLLLTTTVHPWYLLPLLALLPFCAPGPSESAWRWLDLTPWLYLAAAVMLAYLTYLDPANLREVPWVRRTEWWPTLGLLLVVAPARLTLAAAGRRGRRS